MGRLEFAERQSACPRLLQARDHGHSAIGLRDSCPNRVHPILAPWRKGPAHDELRKFVYS